MPRTLSIVRKRRAKTIFTVLAQCGALLALVFFGSGLAAQTLSLDNVPPITLTGSASLSAVSIDPSTGNVIVRSSAGNLTQCTGAAPPLSPVINSFFPSASTVGPGASITLNWSSSNTTSCTPTQGSGTNWPNFGTMGVSGNQTFAAPQAAGTITFQLTCSNAVGQSATQTTQVTVQGGGGGGNCPPIFTQGALGEFDVTFGQAWPAYNDKIRQFVTNGQYFGLRFTATASQTQFGTINTTGFPGDGDGNGRVSISPTAGCFDAGVIGERCVSAASTFPGVSWTNGQSSFVCKLNPGQSYYVNFYFPDCPSGNCGRDFGNIQQLLNMD